MHNFVSVIFQRKRCSVRCS